MAAMWESYLPKALGAVLENAAARSKRQAARRLLEAMGPMRRRVMQILWEVVKEAATKDPYMMECVKAQVRSAIEGVAEDVEAQTEEQLHLTTCSVRQAPLSELIRPPARGRGRCCCLRLRGFVLCHVAPHNKTLWGNLRDPVWWLCVVPTVITAYNVRCTALGILLLLLCFPGPPDEYQLTKYILVLKVNQFVTAGIGCMILGSGQYYYCILFERRDLLTCINTSMYEPFGLWFCLLDYLGSFVLPQLAICAFHCSVRLRPTLTTDSTRRPVAADAKQQQELLACCCCKVAHPAPRRLRMLVRYDLACFIASALMLVVLTALSQRKNGRDLVCDPIITADCKGDPALIMMLNAYWCKVFYALLMFPFLAAWVPDFTPVSFSMITRASRTGYDEDGVCVLFRLARKRRGERDTPEGSDSGDDSSSQSESLSETLPFASGPNRTAPAAPPFGVDWRYWCAGAA